MTSGFFDYARGRGTEGKIGQLNPLGRYAIAEGTRHSPRSTVSLIDHDAEIAQVALFLASGNCFH